MAIEPGTVGEEFYDSGDVFIVDKYGIRDVDLDEDEQFHWNVLQASTSRAARDEPAAHVYIARALSYGDYSGTAVERANVEAVLEEYGDTPGVYEIYGSHGSRAVAVRLTVDDEDLLETLKALTQYAAISDEAVAEKERELEDEAYGNYGRSDFISALEKAHDIDIDDYDDERFSELFAKVLSRTDYGAIIETGGGVLFPIEEMVKQTDLAELRRYGVEYSAEED